MYPRITINLSKLKENAKVILELCKNNHITSCFLVTKVLAQDLTTISVLADCGFTHLADSRIENLKSFNDIPLPKVMLRVPMLSEVKEIVRYSDISLNSELETIKALNNEAMKQNKVHKILLMFDLGDLREGIFYKDDYLTIISEILKLDHIQLAGIGTNLTCYGGIIPTYEILLNLVNIKEKIESNFKIKIDIISGGNSSSIPLLINNKMPSSIDNLRIGEAIMLGRETAYGTIISNMHEDVFTLESEIIELKEKPSYPIGEIGMNSFGEKPKIQDVGIQKRGIIALGKQDVQFENLTPINKNISIIGGSSDHLILDLSRTSYKLGDIISFKVNYPGLLQVMTSRYVKKKYITKEL